MCVVKQENVEKYKPIVFVDKPISKDDDDFFGLNAYVDALQTAIDEGAQLIGVTSDFGYGKSSVSELLKKRIDDEKGRVNKNRIVMISLWSGVSKEPYDVINLHKTFIYQLVSAIKPSASGYIAKRLNPNYGRISLNTTSVCTLFLLITAIVFLIVGIFPIDLYKQIITFNNEDIYTFIKTIGTIFSILILSIIITSNEIIFSNKDSQGANFEITENEITELYRKFILNNKKKLIVVIDDLDRIVDDNKVLIFLKELRKYYVDDDRNNKVTYIVNIKRECDLKKNECKDIKNIDYKKIFDYLLDLKKINSNDYSSYLEKLLQSKENEIKSLIGYNGELIKYPNIKLLVKGDEIGIREIKRRLNNALLIYLNNRKRFPNEIVNFEKCIISAYLYSEYQNEIVNMQDSKFGELVIANRRGDLDVALAETGFEDKDFIKDIKDYIQNNLIDDDYRMYFYNYPKGSKAYNEYENIVRNAILNNKDDSRIDEATEHVEDSTIKEFIDERENLNIAIGNCVLSHKALFNSYLKYRKTKLLTYLDNLDINDDSKMKSLIENILSYEDANHIFDDEAIKEIVKLSLNLDGELFFKQRFELCQRFSNKIHLLAPLFKKRFIVKNEIDMLDLCDAATLIYSELPDFNIDVIEYLVGKYTKQDVLARNDNIIDLLLRNYGLDEYKFSMLSIMYMNKNHKIDEKLEDNVVRFIKNSDNVEYKDNIKNNYIDLINNTIRQSDILVSSKTINNIEELEIYRKINVNICERLYENKNYYMYFVMSIFTNKLKNLHYGDEVVNALLDRMDEIVLKANLLREIRKELILSKYRYIEKFDFLFNDKRTPLLDNEEIEMINLNRRIEFNVVLSLINVENININNCSLYDSIVNARELKQNEIITLFIILRSFDLAIRKEIVDRIDFIKSVNIGKLQYDQRETIKQDLTDIYPLVTCEEKIKYLKRTNYLDEIIEYDLYCDFDDELEELYVSTLNNVNSESINKNTIENIKNFQYYHVFDDSVCNRLFDAGLYEDYIYSIINGNNYFDYDKHADNSDFWNACIKIFMNPSLQRESSFMCKNELFINKIIREKVYAKLDKERYLLISNGVQTIATIKKAYSYGEEYFIKFLEKCNKYKDIETESYTKKMLMNTSTATPEQLRNVVKSFKSTRISSSVIKNYKHNSSLI